MLIDLLVEHGTLHKVARLLNITQPAATGMLNGLEALIGLKLFVRNRPLFYVAIAMSLLALANVFIVFVGRTGHLVGLAMVSLAIFWALPRRYRLAAVLVPPMLFLLAFFSFDKVAQRVSHTTTEISQYSSGVGAATSMDNRLDFWRGSVDAIIEKPLAGSGVGSWATEYNRIQSLKFPGHKALGVGGMRCVETLEAMILDSVPAAPVAGV